MILHFHWQLFVQPMALCWQCPARPLYYLCPICISFKCTLHRDSGFLCLTDRSLRGSTPHLPRQPGIPNTKSCHLGLKGGTPAGDQSRAPILPNSHSPVSIPPSDNGNTCISVRNLCFCFRNVVSVGSPLIVIFSRCVHFKDLDASC